MKEILKKIQEIVTEILDNKFKSLADLEIPKKQGVYIVKDKIKNKIIYVGKSKNLYNRILIQHNSKKNILGQSNLRKKLKELGIEYDKISNYLENSCLFIVQDIENFDINGLVEELLIAVFRKQGEPLLNS